MLRREVVYGMFYLPYVSSPNCNVLKTDSMGNSTTKPDVFVKILLKWLSAHCSQSFTFIGRKLPSGSQFDNTSCGFFAMNVISHGIFSTELLKHANVPQNCLLWFNNLCNATMQQVIPFFLSLRPTTLTLCGKRKNAQEPIVHKRIRDVNTPDSTNSNYNTINNCNAFETSTFQQVASSPLPINGVPLEPACLPEPLVPRASISLTTSQPTLHSYFRLPAKHRPSNQTPPPCHS